MSSLPFISHRLFVAAVRQESGSPRKPSREESPVVEANAARNIEIEVLTPAGPIAAAAERPPRTSLIVGGT